MQTATQTFLGFKAGVKDYRLTYFNDLLAASGPGALLKTFVGAPQ